MSRLPVTGSDNNTWGNVLNDFLSVEHNGDGTLKSFGSLASKADDSSVVHASGVETIAGIKTFNASPVVPTPTSSTHAATKAYVDSAAASGTPDATSGTKGKVQLAGDLGGTATAPTVPNAVKKGDLVVNIEDYAVGNANFRHTDGLWYTDSSHTVRATDDTAVIRALVTAGARHLWFSSRQYRVQWTEGTSFLSWMGKNGVTIRGNGAMLCDETTYTVSPFNPYTSVFNFDACQSITVEGVDYYGRAISNPTVNHGYVGATFVRTYNGCSKIRVDAALTNLRYGVESGAYATPSEGYNKNFHIRLRCSFAAYPIAHYLAENVEYAIDADDVHRVVYLAGCVNIQGTARWANQYVADTCLLITDAMTGTGTSRGCESLDVISIDKGSTVFQASSTCAGIGLSRVDPGIVYKDIKVRVETTSTDTVSSTVGGFKIYSGAAALTTPVAPFNWEPSIMLHNIEVSGTLDHSAQTIDGNTAGDIFVRAWDTSAAHAATVDNFCFRDLIVKPSSGNTRSLYLEVPGVVNNGLQLRNVQASNSTLSLQTSVTVPTTLTNCNILTVNNAAFGCRLILIGTNLGSLTGSIGLTDTVSSAIGGAGAYIRQKTTTLTLSGTATSWASAIPGGCLPLAVSGYVTQTITGASVTGFRVGVGVDPGRFFNTNTLTAGLTFTPVNQAATEQTLWWNGPSALNINVIAKGGGSFSGGQIRLSLTYFEFPAPTS